MSLSLAVSRSTVCSLQLPWPHHVSPTLFPLVSPILSRHSESGAPGGSHSLHSNTSTLSTTAVSVETDAWLFLQPHYTFFCLPSSVVLHLRLLSTRLHNIFFIKVSVRTTHQPISGNFTMNFMNTLLNTERLCLRL